MIDAENESVLQTSFRAAAKVLQIVPAKEPGLDISSQIGERRHSVDDIVQIVLHHLSNTEIPWVLLFDSYRSAFNIKRYFPDNPNGIIIVCALDQFTAANRIGVSPNCRISVEQPLRQPDLKRLFWTSVNGDPDFSTKEEGTEKALEKLIELLDSHTQCIRIAGNFFAPRGRATFRDIEDFMAAIQRLQPVAHADKINDQCWQLWRTIIDEVATEARAEENQEVAQERVASAALEYFWLRTLFSNHFLPTTTMFENLARVRGNCDADPTIRSDGVHHGYVPAFLDSRQGAWKVKEQYETAEHYLSRYGLLKISSRNEDGDDERGTQMEKTLIMCARQYLFGHDAAQYNSDLDGQKVNDRLLLTSLCTLGESIRWTFEDADVAYRHMLIPHVDACLEWGGFALLEANKLDTRTAGTILLNFAAVYVQGGKFNDVNKIDAGTLQRAALRMLEETEGTASDLTLLAMGEVAATLDLQDRFDEAMRLRRTVLEHRKNQYQGDKGNRVKERKYDIAAAAMATSLARFPQFLREATKYRQMVVEHTEAAHSPIERRNENGSHRLALLKAKRELAISYHALGRRLEARQLREAVVAELANQKSVFALNARRELLLSLCDARQFIAAETLSNEVVEDARLLLGSQHPDTLLAESTAATLKHLMGRNEEARVDLEQAVRSFSSICGPCHSLTVNAMIDLAHTYRDLDQYDEAMRQFHEVCDCLRKRNDRYQELRVEMEMAEILRRRGSKAAISRMRSIISSFLDLQCPLIDSSLISARIRLAGYLADKGELEEAAAGYEQILNVFEEKGHQKSSDYQPRHSSLEVNELKARLYLARVYVQLSHKDHHLAETDYEQFSAQVNARLLERNDTTMPEIRFLWSQLPNSLFSLLTCCTDGPATVAPSPHYTPIYQELSSEGLQRRALDLRMQAVLATAGSLTDGLKVGDQLTAQACYDLAQSFEACGQLGKAILLQGAVVGFYRMSFGAAHSETQIHAAVLRSYEAQACSASAIIQ